MTGKFVKMFLKKKAPPQEDNNAPSHEQNDVTNAGNSLSEEINWEEEIQFDPGKRKRIEEYFPNQKDVVRRKYLDNGLCQPRTFDFPYTSIGDKNRRFNPEWFDELA